MLFASLTFILWFLPVVIGGAMVIRRFGSTRDILVFLALASFVFYGWHYPPYIALLLLSISANYAAARRIHETPSKLMTGMAVAANLALLGWFKYAGFFAEMVAAITGANTGIPAILLPLGISFFTFQQIAYLVDIHQGKAEPGDVLRYVFFIAFFPQLIAGPIVHHRDLIPQLSQDRFARFLPDDVAMGLLLFCLGLAKKVLIADNLAVGADTLFATQALGIELSFAESWLGMLCYTFQIYFDFSGYGDMALGLGLIFGLKLPVNFWSPYKAADIIDFWRRWNITLSHFLRDYLYLPLGGNRRGPVRRYANLWIVMLLGGLWHGAGWQFVVWGGLHGLYLTVNHAWRHYGGRPLSPVPSLVLTFGAVIVAWVFFRAENFPQAFDILTAMFGGGGTGMFDLVIYSDPGFIAALVTLAAILVFFTPNSIQILERVSKPRPAMRVSRGWFATAGVLAALALFQTYSNGSNAFIYFQF